MCESATAKTSKPNKPWVLYILSTRDRRHTYSGVTTNLARRLRQHNKEIKGGAKYTSMRGPWHVITCVAGFRNRSHAMQYEYRMHHPRKARGRWFNPVERRLYHLYRDTFDSRREQQDYTKLKIYHTAANRPIWIQGKEIVLLRNLPFWRSRCRFLRPYLDR